MATEASLSDTYEFHAVYKDDVTAGAAESAKSLDNLGHSADTAKVSLEQINQAQAAVAQGLDKVASAGTVGTNSFQRLQRSLDPAGASVDALSRRLNQLDAAYQAGRVSADQYSQLQSAGAARLDQAREKQENFNKSLQDGEGVSKKLQFAMRDLGLQSIDLFQGIATGQPVLRTFIQQGGQVVQVNAAMGVGFRQMAGAIAGTLLSPLALATTAIVGLGAAIVAAGVHFENVQRQLNGIGNSLRATRGDWQSLAQDVTEAGKAVARSMDITRDDATKAVQAIASSPAWSGTEQQLQHLGEVAQQMALVFGGSAADNAKLLAKALTEPGDVAKELGDRHLPTMTAELEHAIQRFDESGRSAQGFAEVLKAVEQAVGGVQNNTTEIQKAVKELDDAWKSATGSGTSFAESIGNAFRSAAATAIQMAAETVKATGDIVGALKGVGRAQLNSGAANIGQFDIPGGGPGIGTGGAAAGSQDPYRHAQMFQTFSLLPNGEAPLSGAVGGPTRPFSAADASYQSGLRQAIGLGDPKNIEKINDELTKMRALRAEAMNPEDVKAFDAAIAGLNKKLEDATKGTKAHKDATEDLLASLARGVQKTNDQAAGIEAMTAAYDQGGEAVNRLRAAQEAQIAIDQKDTRKLTAQQIADAIDQQTQANLRLIDSQNRLEVKKQAINNENTAAVINFETSAIGQNRDETERLVEAMKVRQDLVAKGIDLDSEAAKRLLESADALKQAQIANRNAEASFNELSSFVDRTFDTIGSAIVEAFTQGEGAAINFGNIAKAIVASIAQEFIKLALINPLKSLVTGETLPNLFSVTNVLNGGGSFPNIGLAGQISNGAGFFGSGLFGTSNVEQLGLAGSSLIAEGGGLENPLGLASFANSPEALIAGGGGLSSPLTPVTGASGTGILGGASIGGLIGGVGAGFALGATAGGLIQHSLGKTGAGPLAGAGGGALAGAAIGSVIPVIGTAIGAIIGGLIGGAGGGLIGPKAPSPYAATFVGIDSNGQLTVDPSLTGNQLAPSNLQMVQNQAVDFNRNLATLGVKVTGTGTPPPAGSAGGLGFFGQAKNPAGIVGQNITDNFANIRFGANASIPSQTADVLNRDINNKAFESFDKLGAEVNRVRTFVENTVPALTKLGTSSGSLKDAIDSLNNQFGPALATAKELGYAEDQLTDARDKAIQKAFDAAAHQFSDQQAQYNARFSSAAATLSNDPNVGQYALMQAFDLQANEQRKALSDQLTNVYGDTIKSTQSYADQMAGLERALGAERLVAAKQANEAISQQYDQARQQATQIIQGISDYAHGLNFSASSPLSPTAQLDAANKQFNAVSGAALAGDANSLGKLTQYSDTLLQAGRAVYGSGQGYVDLFNRVTDVLGQVSNLSPDTLTASIYAQETKNQTVQIVDAITSLQNEVKALRTQVAAGSAMPSRLAA